MAYDLEEQEQLDTLKAWWKQHGDKVVTAFTVVLLSIAGYQGWKYYQHQQAAQASALFEVLVNTDNKEVKQIRSISSQIMEKYSGSPYAARAALLAAHSNYEANDAKSALAQTQWAVEHADDSAVKSIALLQLAGLQLEAKQFSEALKTLEEKHDPAYDGLIADMRGDILIAQQKPQEAKKAYAEAVSKLEEKGRLHKIAEQKLDALGS